MELDWLKDFLALAERGNFSRAADARHVTQPAFSRRIRALEDWVGVPLFQRHAHGASLTPAGEHFRPATEEMLRTMERTRRDTRNVGERKAEPLAVAATHALSFTFFPQWIRQSVNLGDFGGINLVSDSMLACEQIMLSGEVHFLLCHQHASATADANGADSICLGHDTLVPLSAPDERGHATWPIPSAASRRTRVLEYSQSSGLGRILAAQRTNAPSLGEVETVFTSQLAATLLSLARNGQGAAWLPLQLADDDLKAGRLVRAGPLAFDVPLEIRLFRSPDYRSPAADRLWQTLAA